MRLDGACFSRSLASMGLISVLPVTFFVVVSYMHQMRGPEWLATWADPSYLHLLNAALVGDLQAPAHTDNPGTPLHILGGAILRIQHAVLGHGQFLDDIVMRPEWYLVTFYNVLLFATTVAYWLSGFIVWRSARSTSAALLVQFSPWCFWPVLTTATMLAPDALVNALATLFSGVFLCEACRTNSQDPPSRRTVTVLGLLAGIAIATKVTSLPLLVAPLILIQSYRGRLLFLAVTVLAFLLGTAPILGRLDHLYSFISRCITHSGQYGGGSSGIDVTAYFSVLERILEGNKVATGLIVLTWAVLIAAWLAGTAGSRQWMRALFAIAVAETCQILLAAKGLEARYAIASLGMIGANLWLLGCICADIVGTRNGHRIAIATLASLTILVVALNVRNISASRTSSRSNRDARERLAAVARGLQRQGYTLVYGHWASSPVNALYVGNRFADGRLSDILAEKYPRSFFVSWNGQLADWTTEGLDWTSLLVTTPRVVLQADSFSTRPVEATGQVRLSRIGGTTREECPYFVEELYLVEAVNQQIDASSR
jgi:hypothetical protein